MVFTQVVTIKDKAPGTQVYNYADSFWCTYIVSVAAASVAEMCKLLFDCFAFYRYTKLILFSTRVYYT